MAPDTKSALEKYQNKPFFGSSHSWAIEIAEKLPKNSPVLDIGCGSAPIGLALKERGFTELYAVEVDEAAKDNAKEIYKTVTNNLETFGNQKFKLILLLDVIEHLPNPELFLRAVEKFIAPDGMILISVPNVAHWSVRIPLFFGFFNYTDRAILDRTHLHFFTRRSLIKLLNKFPDLFIEQTGATIEPAEFLLPRPIWDNEFFKGISKFRLIVANLLPGLMAYQHVVVVKKRL